MTNNLNMNSFEPLKIEMHKLLRPLLTGIPCNIRDGIIQEKEIVNRSVLDILGGLPNFTGEIVVGSPTTAEMPDRTRRYLADENAIDLFVFWVYDMKTNVNYPLKERLRIAEAMIGPCGPNIQYVDHELVETQEAFDAYEARIRNLGFTGVVVREPFGTFGTEDEVKTL